MNVYKNYLLLLFSIIVSILLIEIFLKIFYPQKIVGSWVMQDKTGLYINASHKTSIDSDENNKIITYNFGKFFNRKKNYDIDYDKTRILVLGDSYTFGHRVANSYTFVDLLQNEHSDFVIINSSVIGWGTSDYVKFNDNYCNFIKPQKTIIFLNFDDFRRSSSDRFYKIGINNQILFQNQPINKLKKFLNESIVYKLLIEHSHVVNLFRKLVTNAYYNSLSYIKNFNKMNTKNEMNIKTLNEESKILIKVKSLFIYANQVSKKCKSRLIVIDLGLENNNLDSFFEENKIEYYDLSTTKNIIYYKKNIDKVTIKDDGHPNILGHSYIFKAIKEKTGNFIFK